MVGSFYFFLPVFFLLVFSEYFYSIYKNIQLYSGRQTLANLACGILQFLLIVLFSKSFLDFYEFIYQKVGLFHFENNYITWIFTIFLVDFVYYWNHRLHHRIPILWGLHAVHHQSHELNFSNGMRPAILSFFTTIPSYTIIAILGIPSEIFFIVQTTQTGLQIFSHTTIPFRLGFLERIFVLPSAHRVHHGTQSKYANKNFGAVFIIWDYFFKTQQNEEEKPYFGVVDPMVGFSPIKSMVHPFLLMFHESKKLKKMKDKLSVWFKPQKETSDSLKGYEEHSPKLSGLELLHGLLLSLISLLWVFSVVYFSHKHGISALPEMFCSFLVIVALSLLLDRQKSYRLVSMSVIIVTSLYAYLYLVLDFAQGLILFLGCIFILINSYSTFLINYKKRPVENFL